MARKRSWKRGFLIFLAVTAIIIMSIGITNIESKPVFSEGSRTRHLIVISVDALDARDFDELKTLPNFSEIMDNGSYVREVVGVYPSLTYPSHTSIITGTYPDKHGIFTNEVSEAGSKKQSWYWYKRYIKVKTLYEAAREANMKVGAMFWPVTAGANINYNCPEIWTVKEGQNQTWLSLKNGSPLFLFMIDRKFGNLRDGTKQPQLDNFTAASTSYMIKSEEPNLVMVHFTDLDHQKHKHGMASTEAMNALKRIDTHIGEIIKAVRDAGIYDETTFVITGDHAFQDVDYRISINSVFKTEGLITVDTSGNITDWKAYANYCDGSVQIKLKDNNDMETYKKVEGILNSMKNDPAMGIEAVYTKEQAAAKRVTGDFIFMAEARPGYFFVNDWDKDVIVKIDKNNIDEDDDNSYLATHGFDPQKPGYRTFFMACGAGIKKGVVIPSINIVDEGPTMAELLGLNLPDADGRILNEILEK